MYGIKVHVNAMPGEIMDFTVMWFSNDSLEAESEARKIVEEGAHTSQRITLSNGTCVVKSYYPPSAIRRVDILRG